MITGPEEGTAAAHGRLRASQADREQVIDTLKTAFADGRLDKDELDARAGQALAARTYTELATATVGIPAAPAQAPPRRSARPPVNKEAVTRGLAAAGAMIPPAMFVTALYGAHALTPSPPRPPRLPAAVHRVARRDHLRGHHACQAASAVDSSGHPQGRPVLGSSAPSSFHVTAAHSDLELPGGGRDFGWRGGPGPSTAEHPPLPATPPRNKGTPPPVSPLPPPSADH